MLEWLTQTAFELVATFGYVGLVLGLIVNSAGVPIPSEVLIPLAGLLARQERMDMVTVVAVGTIAQTVGAILSYYLGATNGLALAKKYGKYVFFSQRKLALTQRWFDKYGDGLTFIGRCIPVIRTYIGFPAGISRMPFRRFVIASFAGSLVWTILLATLGYRLGDHLQEIEAVFRRFSLLIVSLLAVGAVWYVKRHLKQEKRAA
jgi:membrane protein DedA with SNARE-associated domain